MSFLFFFLDGYGKVLFEKVFHTQLPLTLGRDFAGVIRAVGKAVKDFEPGDEVMGVIPPQNGTGSHAQFVVVSSSLVVMKPLNLTMVEAASIPYAGLTAWSGLRFSGGLGEVSNGKQVLIMGASGGVGSIATQLCKLWGSKVNNSAKHFCRISSCLLHYNCYLMLRWLPHVQMMPYH